MTSLITRQEAKAKGERYYFTGQPCPRGHLAPRFTSVGTCTACGREKAMEKYVHTTNRRRTYSDAEGFIAAAVKAHEGRYSYGDVVYTNAHTKVAITCPTHGAFFQTPTNHVQGKGCPRCSAEAFGERSKITLEDFVERARLVWKDRWDYTNTVYTGARSLLTITCPLHGAFQQTQSNHLGGKIGCTKCNHMQSKGEDAVSSFISRFGEVRRRDRTVLRPRELDIYLPNQKMAVEYCGEYWHSLGDKDSVREKSGAHHQKYLDCKALGIRLFTIYESEWLERNYAIRRLLRNALGKSKGKLMARKCDLRKVPLPEARAFYERYHPQGGDGNGDHYGLYWRGKLVACMRFTHGANDRGTAKERVWTLTRYATRITVAGAASRLFKAFVDEYKPSEVKSFSDNRYFEGGMYETLGFVLEEETGPDYQVWSPKLGLRPKSHYQRRALPKRLEEHGVTEPFDPETDTRSEAEMTFLMKCRRLYDAGKRRWVWRP
jgi:hypothetical protein